MSMEWENIWVEDKKNQFIKKIVSYSTSKFQMLVYPGSTPVV